MKLSEIFEALSFGEINQMSVGSGTRRSGIDPTEYPKIISHINLGMMALHTMFPIIEKELTIKLENNITQYHLHQKHALTNPTPNVPKYIIDTVAEPFLGNIIVVTAAYDESGDMLLLNDYNAVSEGVFLANSDILQVPYPDERAIISLMYQSHPPAIMPDVVDPTEVEVDLPRTLLEPLLAYVGSRVYGALNSQEGMAKSATLMQKYIGEVQAIKALNLFNSSDTQTLYTPEMRGFV